MRLTRLGVLCVTLLSSLALVGTASAARHDKYPLHVGSSGPNVAALQWLLTGHKPSAYRGIHTYKGKPSGYWGKATTQAVADAKWKLGYPMFAVKRAKVDKLFILFLEGKRARPIRWHFIAAKRTKAHQKKVINASWVHKIIGVESTQVGVHEIPWGSNWGWNVPTYLAATGLRFPAPWCAAFQQWSLLVSGYGRIANDSAGVFYIVDWSRQRGWLRSIPAPGRLVAYLGGDGHIGMVVEVDRYGYTTIEGNYANGVYRVRHGFGEYKVFISLPNVS